MVREYKSPSITDVFYEVSKIRDIDSFFRFFEVMPTYVDVIFYIGIFGFLYGCWVLLMGILTDNQE